MALIDNLVAYYKLDGNGNGEVGGNSISPNGGGTSWVSAVIGQGALIPTNNYLQTSWAPSSLLNTSTGWTFACWLKDPAPPTNAFTMAGILKSSSGSTSNQIKIGVDTHAPTYKLQSEGWTGESVITDARTAINGTGNFFVVFVVNSTSQKYYVNGVLQWSATYSGATALPGSGGWILGWDNYSSDAGRYMNSIFDEVGFWSRMLSAAEVTELYNGGAGLTYPFSASTNTTNFFNFF